MLHVAVTSNYATITKSDEVLTRMTTIYGKEGGPWHFPNTDVHFALLGKSMDNYGRSHEASVCNSAKGFGFTDAMTGAISRELSNVSICSIFVPHNHISQFVHAQIYLPPLSLFS